MSFDFDAAVTAPFRMQPGLRRLSQASPHFTPLAPGGAAQREKLAVLSAFWQEALLATPQADAGAALDAVCRQAAHEHPGHLGWDGQRAHCVTLGVAVQDGEVLDLRRGAFGLGDEIGRCLRALPRPWRLPGLLSLAFLEDLALIDLPEAGTPATVPWMCVTLPSHWSPSTKVGKPFAAIHAPVADNRLLLAAGESLMALVSVQADASDAAGSRGGNVGQRWERFVWTVSPQPRRHAHPRRVDPVGWPQGARTDFDTQAWWRTERQTFIPVPSPRGGKQAVFTIAVESTPLAQALDHPGRARRLHEAIASMSSAVLQYRGLQTVREPLLAWLEARMQDESPDRAAGTEP